MLTYYANVRYKTDCALSLCVPDWRFSLCVPDGCRLTKEKVTVFYKNL